MILHIVRVVTEVVVGEISAAREIDKIPMIEATRHIYTVSDAIKMVMSQVLVAHLGRRSKNTKRNKNNKGSSTRLLRLLISLLLNAMWVLVTF